MDSGMIGKIDKAKRYAEERERINFKSFEVVFRGDNNLHTTQFSDGKWNCTCNYFQGHGVCGHTMAMEIVLSGMLPNQTE